ncbi:VanZ family protein [Bradyrhizobium japonicum]|uniref:VanZ family protein n=1 Tax=Bradyrhizobium japonicum TaxID=375 RepID=UPI001BA6AB76|nr:VanZ family protein [Bradyrhizobium japonicum]MBR0959018.1 VanZ family protein [Bradyrhizobium japonicum]
MAMIQRAAIIFGWAALVFIAFATLSPIQSRPTLAGLRLEHFAAFAVTGFAFAFGAPHRTRGIFVMMILSALILESVQLLTPDRHARLLDALVKAIGAVCGVGASRLALGLGYLIEARMPTSAKRHR